MNHPLSIVTEPNDVLSSSTQLNSSPETLTPGEIVAGYDLTKIYDERKKKRRASLVQSALNKNDALSQTVQEKFLSMHLAQGWGRLSHGITRQLKSPGRCGLKLVDVALLFTVYDKTIAQVVPVAFAPISTDDFETETGMHETNIRIALNSLLNRGILLKTKTGQINFWGLNPHYFSKREEGNRPPGKLPGGNLPVGTAPCVNQGDLPGVDGGQTTRGQSPQTPGDQKEKADAKNPSEESKKESLLSAESFPEDMTARWSAFEKSSLLPKVKIEREIFQELLISKKSEFFENCGRVVRFLEKEGITRKGKVEKVHSPMEYIRFHWDLNFSRCLKGEQDQKATSEQLDREARAKTEREAKQLKEEREKQELAAWTSEIRRNENLILSKYPSPSQLDAFVEEALLFEQNSFLAGVWKSTGWGSQLVRSAAVSHFLKVRAGERSTQVKGSQIANLASESA